MDLRPDPVLERIRRSVAAALAPLESGAPADRAAAALREVEAVALEAPIEAGGFELGVACGAVTARELGRRALPDVYGPVALAVDGVRSAGAAEGDVAAALVAGAAVVGGGFDRWTVAVRGVGGSGGPDVIGGRVLSGSVVVEERGDAPDAWCCVAASAGDEVLLVLIPAGVWRVRARRAAVLAVPASVTDSGADPALCSVDLDGVVVGGGGVEVIGSFGGRNSQDGRGDQRGQRGQGGEGWQRGDGGQGIGWASGVIQSDPDGLLARARIRHAAYLAGLAEGAQAAAVHHAARRLQFGRPLLDNQALAFPLAQAHIELTALDLSIRHAARLADDGARDPRAVALAAVETLALAQEAATTTVRLAMQVHGARSLTAAEPIHAFHLALRSFGTVLGARSALWREAGLRRLLASQAAVVPVAAVVAESAAAAVAAEA